MPIVATEPIVPTVPVVPTEPTGSIKNVPITKSLLGWIFAKLQIPTATKSKYRTSGVQLSQFCFHMFNFVSWEGVQNA